jgi:amino acid permease
MDQLYKNKYPAKHLYAWGLLQIIPLIGAIVGLVLLIMGFSYRDRILSVIGALGILFTIAVYASLFYYMGHGKLAQQGFKEISQHDINLLAKQIE